MCGLGMVSGILRRERRWSKACGHVCFKCIERPQLGGGTWGWGDPWVPSSHAGEGLGKLSLLPQFRTEKTFAVNTHYIQWSGSTFKNHIT